IVLVSREIAMYRLVLILLFVAPLTVRAAETLPPNARIAKLSVQPTSIEFTSPYQYAQVIVTATLEDGTVCDVTRIAAASISKEKTGKYFISYDSNGLVRPERYFWEGTGAI